MASGVQCSEGIRIQGVWMRLFMFRVGRELGYIYITFPHFGRAHGGTDELWAIVLRAEGEAFLAAMLMRIENKFNVPWARRYRPCHSFRDKLKAKKRLKVY